jgi:sterol 24-C-methyltransferase
MTQIQSDAAPSAAAAEQAVLEYYRRRGSRWGYRLLLQGTRHFGYYPPGRPWISMRAAMRRMEDELGGALGLPPGSRVLDAGCGEGAVALRLADRFAYRVSGVDLLPESIARAQRAARGHGGEGRTSFTVGTYMDLPHPDGTFDGAYTMETLIHAPDHREALRELSRVIRPGGRIVLMEYSTAPPDSQTEEEARKLRIMGEQTALHSLPQFTHGALATVLQDVGIDCVEVRDISDRVVPMVRLFHALGVVPHELARLLGRPNRFVNAAAGVEILRLRDILRYNVVVGVKRG